MIEKNNKEVINLSSTIKSDDKDVIFMNATINSDVAENTKSDTVILDFEEYSKDTEQYREFIDQFKGEVQDREDYIINKYNIKPEVIETTTTTKNITTTTTDGGIV